MDTDKKINTQRRRARGESQGVFGVRREAKRQDGTGEVFARFVRAKAVSPQPMPLAAKALIEFHRNVRKKFWT